VVECRRSFGKVFEKVGKNRPLWTESFDSKLAYLLNLEMVLGTRLYCVSLDCAFTFYGIALHLPRHDFWKSTFMNKGRDFNGLR